MTSAPTARPGPPAERPAADGLELHRLTPEAEVRAAMARRRGGGDWELRLPGGGEAVASGGLLFHYNSVGDSNADGGGAPYGDVHMEVVESQRGRGHGARFVEAMVAECYALGMPRPGALQSFPAPRCIFRS
jgi:hypothetical protein